MKIGNADLLQNTWIGNDAALLQVGDGPVDGLVQAGALYKTDQQRVVDYWPRTVQWSLRGRCLSWPPPPTCPVRQSPAKPPDDGSVVSQVEHQNSSIL